MNILAFTGKRGHGKSTAAEALVRKHGWLHLNFADPLREVCHIVYGVSYEEMLDPVLKEQPLTRWPYKSPRELLQQIGTEMFRNYIPETWIENWKSRALAALDTTKPFEIGGVIRFGAAPGVVCSDCRFLNEEGAVRALGGKIIRIDDPRKARTDAAAQHASELEMEQIVVDSTILNDQGIAELEAAALQFAG